MEIESETSTDQEFGDWEDPVFVLVHQANSSSGIRRSRESSTSSNSGSTVVGVVAAVVVEVEVVAGAVAVFGVAFCIIYSRNMPQLLFVAVVVIDFGCVVVGCYAYGVSSSSRRVAVQQEQEQQPRPWPCQ